MSPTLQLWIDHWQTRITTSGLGESASRFHLLAQSNRAEPLSWEAFASRAGKLDRHGYISFSAIARLRKLIDKYPAKWNIILVEVLDELQPLDERLLRYHTHLKSLYNADGDTFYTEVKEDRTLAAYLTLRNPAKYVFYLDEARGDVQRFADTTVSPGYTGWIQLIETVAHLIAEKVELREAYLAEISLYNVADPEYRQAAYDLLYSVGRTSGLGRIDPISHIPSPPKMAKLSMSGANNKEGIPHINEEVYRDARRRKVVLVHANTLAKGQSKISQGEVFNTFPQNSWFYLCRENLRIDLLGRFTDDVARPAQHASLANTDWLERTYKLVGYPRSFEPYSAGIKKWWTPNDNSTFIEITKAEWAMADELLMIPFFGKPLLNMADITSSDGTQTLPGQSMMRPNHPLNQILYGPPGTGKTYATRRMAVEICDGLASSDHSEVKGRYKKLVDEGRIVFTTFHQSMSYEDFVEGIKPEVVGNNVTYAVKPGLLMRMAVEASFQYDRNDLAQTNAVDFAQKVDQFFAEVSEHLADNESFPLTLKNGGTILAVDFTEQGNLVLRHEGGSHDYTVSRARLSRLNAGIPDFDNLVNINREFQDIIGGSNASIMWAVLNRVRKVHLETSQFKASDVDFGVKLAAFHSRLQQLNPSVQELDGSVLPYVLIIDEINRGNTPAIFGELITLIEEDKRLGNKEQLTAKLPYSGKKFGVPNNLYIIGTMNTADRSVEALDAALRRRFSFIELAPNPGVWTKAGASEATKGIIEIDGFGTLSLPEFLTTLNKRIVALRDRDHAIGHAYFMGVDSAETLAKVLATAVIPLLQEYFYGDYAQLVRILGDKFIEPVNTKVNFAPRSSTNALELPNAYKIAAVNKENLGAALTAGGFGKNSKDDSEDLSAL